MATCLAMFFLVCVLCWLTLHRQRYIILILWPITIYFYGPAMTALFSDTPVLSRYIFPEDIIPETLMIFAYFMFFLFLDEVLDISSVVRASFNSEVLAKLARGPLFLILYVTVVIAATALQGKILMDVGSVFTGNYVLNSVAEGTIPFWGFLAGLYELIFLCVILFILSGQRSKVRIFVVGAYIVTSALRVAGGTRLILIKELAVICILFYLRGTIRRRYLVLTVLAVMMAGSAIGLARGAGDDASKVLGPLYGLVMEAGLNALTLNVAYQVEESGYTGRHDLALQTVEYVVLSSIPSFLRFGISQADIEAMSPYNAAIGYGFDTASPVGSMSGFATLCYLSDHPMASTLVLVLILSLLIKLSPPGPTKKIIIVVLSISAIHFWRDPVDIAVKNIVQDVLCCVVLLYVPALSKWRERSLGSLQPKAGVLAKSNTFERFHGAE